MSTEGVRAPSHKCGVVQINELHMIKHSTTKRPRSHRHSPSDVQPSRYRSTRPNRLTWSRARNGIRGGRALSLLYIIFRTSGRTHARHAFCRARLARFLSRTTCGTAYTSSSSSSSWFSFLSDAVGGPVVSVDTVGVLPAVGSGVVIAGMGGKVGSGS